MGNQSNEIKNRVNPTGVHCVWTRSDRTPGAPLTARWVCDQPQRSITDRHGVSDRKEKDEDSHFDTNLQLVNLPRRFSTIIAGVAAKGYAIALRIKAAVLIGIFKAIIITVTACENVGLDI